MGGTTEQQRRYRANRIAKGLCAQCAKNPPDEGFVNCSSCRTRIAKWKNDNVERRRDQHRDRSRRLLVSMQIFRSEARKAA
jgi:hypothetical protein